MPESTELFAPLKVSDGEIEVEYSISVPFSMLSADPQKQGELAEKIRDVDAQIDACTAYVDKLNAEIDRLTNQADKFDYLISVASGVICAVIDVVFVGEFDFDGAKAWSQEKIDDLVQKTARRVSKSNEDMPLGKAVKILEDKFEIPSDDKYIKEGGGGTISSKRHHIDDFAHHPTLLGLVAALISEFFRLCIFVDENGKWIFRLAKIDKKELIKLWAPIVISALSLWLANLAEDHIEECGKDIPKPIEKLVNLIASSPAVIRILRSVHNWVGHLISDMDGSKSSAGGGMGIPGIFLSLLKELSSIPPLNLTPLPEFVDQLFENGFDLREELAVAHELGRQAIPVMINEFVVRFFYFVRHLVAEIKAHDGDLKLIEWKNTIPFGNRTVERMMTIASGTFTAVDMAFAAIESVDDAALGPAAFLKSFALNVNFVGIGRFAVAVITDLKMGAQKKRLENERILIYDQLLHLSNAKLSFVQAEMWIELQTMHRSEEAMWTSCEQTAETLLRTYNAMFSSLQYFNEQWHQIVCGLSSISGLLDRVQEKNPGLLESLFEEPSFDTITEDEDEDE